MIKMSTLQSSLDAQTRKLELLEADARQRGNAGAKDLAAARAEGQALRLRAEEAETDCRRMRMQMVRAIVFGVRDLCKDSTSSELQTLRADHQALVARYEATEAAARAARDNLIAIKVTTKLKFA
jgi:hypothetical protein